MPAVHLVRHGQASFGAADYDVLADTGQEQAVLVHRALADRGVAPERIVSGALRRQVATAQPWIDAGAAHVIDDRWDEYDSTAVLAAYGSDASLETAGADAREFQRVLDDALTAWAQGADGFAAFRDRCVAALEATVAATPSGDAAVVVTSGGVVAMLAAHALDLPDTAMVAFNRVAVNGAVTTLVSGRSGTSLVTFNEHGFLPRALVTYR